MKMHAVRFLLMITLLFSWLSFSTLAHAAAVLYAKPTATGTGDCSSWENACTLQTALTGAASDDEIWAAAGTYKPTTLSTDRSATFQLKDDVAIYGGFARAETELTQRDTAANLTVLSGDIDNDDTQTPIITDLTTVAGNTTNSIHVVTGAAEATLDGFTITAGYAYEPGYPNYVGGGMFNNAGSLTLAKITFRGNSANSGGGLYNSSSNPTLTNVIFSNNNANSCGGMEISESSPTLTNVIFSDNSASYGGGFCITWHSNPILTNVTFNDNLANNFYGGNGGGMYNGLSNPTLTNVTFSGNSGYLGGGIYNNYSNPILTNVTLSGNSAYLGGGIYNSNSNPQIRNTIIWGNTAPSGGEQIYDIYSSIPVVSDSVVQDGFAGTNIISADPLLSTLGNYGGFTQTIPLFTGSSAIDTGDDDVCPPTDQRGVDRPIGAHCDIGAYEFSNYNSYLPLVLRN